MGYLIYKSFKGRQTPRRFMAALGTNLSAVWSTAHTDHRVMAVNALLAALAIVRQNVRDGRADAGSLSSARIVAAVKKTAKTMPAKDKEEFSAEALRRTLSPARYSIDAGNADVPPGTVAPWRAVFNNCNRSLHFNMVLRPMAKGFIQSAAAHLAAESIASADQAACDDDESSADGESVQEAHDFNPHRVLRRFLESLKARPVGGGGKKHDIFLDKFRTRMGRFATKALGETPAAADVNLVAALRYLRPYNYEDEDPNDNDHEHEEDSDGDFIATDADDHEDYTGNDDDNNGDGDDDNSGSDDDDNSGSDDGDNSVAAADDENSGDDDDEYDDEEEHEEEATRRPRTSF